MEHLAENLTKKITKQEPKHNSRLAGDKPIPSLEDLEAIGREAVSDAASERENDKQIHLEQKIGRAGIPKRFVNKSFGNYNAVSKGQRSALNVSMKYVEKFESVLEGGVCLVMTGKPGTGKTHLGAAILSSIINKGKTGMFISVSEILRKIRSTFGGGDITEQEVFDSFKEPDLLVIDEVGVSIGDAEKRKAMLFDVLNARYNEMKPTILLGNLTSDEMGGFLGDRVMDRMMEGNGMVIPFDWESARQQIPPNVSSRD